MFLYASCAMTSLSDELVVFSLTMRSLRSSKPMRLFMAMKLFWELHIHKGVNTSAMSLERAAWRSLCFRMRGWITLPCVPVISGGVMGSWYW